MDNLTILRGVRRPYDLMWNHHLHQPHIIQKSFGDDLRITWNPDDQRFYVEGLFGEDWETIRTYAGDPKGWSNAKDWCKRIQKGLAPKQIIGETA